MFYLMAVSGEEPRQLNRRWLIVFSFLVFTPLTCSVQVRTRHGLNPSGCHVLLLSDTWTLLFNVSSFTENGSLMPFGVLTAMIDNPTIARRLMLVGGILSCLLGLIGNLLNICVFTRWSRARRIKAHAHKDRSRNCPLYLLVSSWANLILVVYPLLTRIMFDGYQYAIKENDAFLLCKLRYFIVHSCDLISITCVCMATLDRYLISSREVRLRRLSTTMQQTRQILVLLVVLIGVHSIPLVIYYDVSDGGRCMITSRPYSFYYLYVFQIILHGIIPVIFLSSFALLTSRSWTTSRQATSFKQLTIDKQLSRMIVLLSIAIILSSIPYSIEHFYTALFIDQNTSLSPHELLYHVISSILFYTTPVTSFYIFYISTPNFRVHLHNLFACHRRANRYGTRSRIIKSTQCRWSVNANERGRVMFWKINLVPDSVERTGGAISWGSAETTFKDIIDPTIERLMSVRCTRRCLWPLLPV